MSDDIDSVGGRNITAMTVWSWQRVYGAAMDKIVDSRAVPVINRLAQECVEGPSTSLSASALKSHWSSIS
jgi:hypothetical protein